MEKNKIEHYKVMLLKLQKELLTEIESKIKSNDLTIIKETGDDADKASTYQNLKFDQLMSDRDKMKLNQYKNALNKIESGDYGICEECGDEISDKRINAIPDAILCVECKTNLELEVSPIKDHSEI